MLSDKVIDIFGFCLKWNFKSGGRYYGKQTPNSQFLKGHLFIYKTEVTFYFYPNLVWNHSVHQKNQSDKKILSLTELESKFSSARNVCFHRL